VQLTRVNKVVDGVKV